MTTTAPQAEIAEYELTPRELKALSAQEMRRQSRIPRIRMKNMEGASPEVQKIGPDHADIDTGFALMGESLGTSDHEFLRVTIAQLSGEMRN